MEKLTGVNSRIHQAREQKRDISVRSVSQDFRKLHHGQSPVFFTSARLKPNISHYFVLFSVCFSLHQINSRKITHFLLFFFVFHVVFSFSQHHFNSRKHSALLSIFASQAWKQQISEEFKGQWCSNSIVWTEFPIGKVIHWLSKFWDVGCAPQTIDMDQDIMSGFLAAEIVVLLLTWYWQYERSHLKAHDSDCLRTFFGCLTPAVTDRVLRLHAADQQFHQLSFALVNFFKIGEYLVTVLDYQLTDWLFFVDIQRIAPLCSAGDCQF